MTFPLRRRRSSVDFTLNLHRGKRLEVSCPSHNPYLKTSYVMTPHPFYRLLLIWISLILSYGQDTTPVTDEIKIRAHAEKIDVPLFFHLEVTQTSSQTAPTTFKHEFNLKGKILQAEEADSPVLRLDWNGEGKVSTVTGEGLERWSLTQVQDQRYLELTLKPATRDINLQVSAITVKARTAEASTYELSLPHLGKGEAAGFSARLNLISRNGFSLRPITADGFFPLELQNSSGSQQSFTTTQGGLLKLRSESSSSFPDGINVQTINLSGELIQTEKKPHVRITLEMSVEAEKAGIKFPLLEGHKLALESLPEGVQLLTQHHRNGLQRVSLETLSAGKKDLTFSFLLPVDKGLRQGFSFKMLRGHVIPLHLTGVEESVEFIAESTYRPRYSDGKWSGFSPSREALSAYWQPKALRGEGELFFNTESLEQATLKSGLLEQDWRISHKILQGEITELEYELTGEGDILSVETLNLLDWTINEEAGARVLLLRLTRPDTETFQVNISSQSALKAFPVKVTPLRLTPVGAARHIGFIKVRPLGAVQLTVSDTVGLTQLSPEQFPGQMGEKNQQEKASDRSSVYRYPLPERSYTLSADQIKPEVNLSQILTYELGLSDRSIRAEVELDISEAPLREWELEIPADYSVVSVSGAEVADYVVGTEVQEGNKVLKALFSQDLSGRQLIKIHLEKNTPAGEGRWVLPPLRHPAAESLRGSIGIAVAPGFRLKENAASKLLELPLNQFPKNVKGLQHVYRIRETGWAATMDIQAVPQSIQSDLYHLHSLKDGVDYTSVVVNYFITGAPVEEWKLALPEGAGNVSVEGRDIRTTRTADNTLEIKLQQPALGSYTLLVTYEKEIGAQGGKISAGQLTPLNVRNERGFIQIVSPVQLKHEASTSGDGLFPLDLLELPAEYRLLTSAPSLATYQYTSRPFKAEMDVEWFNPAETLGQIVKFSEAHSRISRDGEVVTDLTYHLKSRSENSLRVTLSDDAKIWSVQVNGASVSPRRDGKDILIPLPSGITVNDEITAKLRVGHKSEKSRGKTVPLSLPVLHCPVLKLDWGIKGGDGQGLRVKSGSLGRTEKISTRNGFSWIMGEGAVLSLLLLLSMAVAFVMLKLSHKHLLWRVLFYLTLAAAFTFCLLSVKTALGAGYTSSPLSAMDSLNFSPKLINAGEEVKLTLHNQAKPSSGISLLGWLCLILGGGLMLFTLPAKSTGGILTASVLLLIGCLLQGGGAFWFFLLYLVVLIVIIVMIFKSIDWSPNPRNKSDPEDPTESVTETPVPEV